MQMKKLNIGLLITCTICLFWHCNHKKTSSFPKENKEVIYDVNISNEVLLDSLSDFIVLLEDTFTSSLIVTVYMSKNSSNSVNIIFSEMLNLSELTELPSFVSKIDGQPIFIFCEYETFWQHSDSYKKYVKYVARKTLLNDVIDEQTNAVVPPITYTPIEKNFEINLNM